MILQVHTEKELIGLVESLKKEVEQLRVQINHLAKQPCALNDIDILAAIKKNVTLDFVNKIYGR